jgi:hypothetical protein
MQAGEAIIENHSHSFEYLNSLWVLAARFFVRLVGCWHLEMGRPVTLGGETYRACLDCGARRRFDTNRWSMHGPYYFSLSYGGSVGRTSTRISWSSSSLCKESGTYTTNRLNEVFGTHEQGCESNDGRRKKM